MIRFGKPSSYLVAGIPFSSELYHHGIKGQRWGIRRFQNLDRTLTPAGKERYGRNTDMTSSSIENLIRSMKKIKYEDFSLLKSAEQVKRTAKGSCHDQVMYEFEELRKLGKEPKGIFVMEYDNNNRGGMTHSLVYYEENGKCNWVENAWSERAGITQYNNKQSIINEIKKAHKTGEFGDQGNYSNIVFGVFDDKEHYPGEDLQTLVDKCLK